MEYIRTVTAEGMASNVRANLLSFGVNAYLMTNELKPIKTRFIDERSNQQLMRMDENDEVADYGWDLPDTPFDAMIISDYDKGFLSVEKIFELVEAFDGPVFIDSKKSKLPKKGCFIKINELEDSRLKGIYRNKIVTKGSSGAEYKGKLYSGEKVPCFDVAGAGDTFLTALVYFYLECGKIEKSIPYANKAAAIAVQNQGTYVLTGDDINDLRS
jgi:D-beta-D-heptose 7-phosphate kinase/D-beta-D-heptose 1-phosphate adenosyltransferase|tara:strand:- start:507 stop:1148 length:642 start_codon:yes stop_codon:yes gene_type:complete